MKLRSYDHTIHDPPDSKIMSKRILIVEDSTMMRRVIANALREAGHSIVGEAGSGQEALELYTELKPDLVTMDITMRGMDGITASKEIMDQDSSAKILILSNLDDEKYRDEVERIGAIGMINKHDTKQLLDFIND